MIPTSAPPHVPGARNALALAISLVGLLRAFPSERRWRTLGGLGPEPGGANRLVR